MAKEQTKKTEIPGVAPQPAEFFYTGKPYDADLGAYTFNYRNYDPELKRWTSADPSGFPDGVNNYRYCEAPTMSFDPFGLTTYYYQYFGQSWNTSINCTTDNSKSISLTGITAGVGIGSNGPTGQLTFSFSITTQSVIISQNSSTTLTNTSTDPNPTGGNWQKVGGIVTTSNNTSTSTIQYNTALGNDRYYSLWSSDTVWVGYQQWQE